MEIVLLAWLIPYLFLLAVNEAKFPRYLLAISRSSAVWGRSCSSISGGCTGGTVRLAALTSRWRAQSSSQAAARGRRRGSGERRAHRASRDVADGAGLLGDLWQPHTQMAASEWFYAQCPERFITLRGVLGSLDTAALRWGSRSRACTVTRMFLFDLDGHPGLRSHRMVRSRPK